MARVFASAFDKPLLSTAKYNFKVVDQLMLDKWKKGCIKAGAMNADGRG